MTKWERIFKSHHPKARIERSPSNYLYVYRDGIAGKRSADWIGCGPSAHIAWMNACDALRLDNEKSVDSSAKKARKS